MARRTQRVGEHSFGVLEDGRERCALSLFKRANWHALDYELVLSDRAGEPCRMTVSGPHRAPLFEYLFGSLPAEDGGER
jgi:hypothetical protein